MSWEGKREIKIGGKRVKDEGMREGGKEGGRKIGIKGQRVGDRG